MTAARLLLLVVKLASLLTGLAAAQRHSGLWLGLGYGLANFSCDTCTHGSPLSGWDYSGGFGVMLGPHARVGAEVGEWFNGLKDGRPLPGIFHATVSLAYYPRMRGGPFVKGGAGLSLYELGKGTGDPIEPIRDTVYASGSAWGYTLGVGWEFPWPSNRGSSEARVTYAFGNRRTLRAPGGAIVATGWKPSVLLIEVGVR